MAGRPMTWQDFAQVWILDPAPRFSNRASQVEMATRRPMDGARNLARDFDAPSPEGRIEDWYGRLQRSRIGVQRRLKQIALVRQFDDPAEIHHGDSMADVLNNRKVMSNEQIG